MTPRTPTPLGKTLAAIAATSIIISASALLIAGTYKLITLML